MQGKNKMANQDLEQKAEIFVEDRMAPTMVEFLHAQTCQTTVVRIKHAEWGYGALLSEYGLHVEVPIPDFDSREGGIKTFLFQDARKIRQLMEHFHATDATELAGKQTVVYFDPRSDSYGNPMGISAPNELEKYVRQRTQAEKSPTTE